MLKKLFSIAALTSLLVGGLSATQANAVTANVDPANVLNGGASFNIDLASDATEVVIPELPAFQLLTQPHHQLSVVSHQLAE